MAKTDVDAQSEAVARMAEEWPMLDALVGGTLAMRKAGKALLPQWPKETEESYKVRLKTATLFPAFMHTAAVMAAKPLARPIKIENGPLDFENWEEDIDRKGTDLHGFSSQLMQDCLHKGLTGVMVEYPRAEGVATRAQEIAAGVRPYLTRYPANCILGWRTEYGPDGEMLTQLRLLEHIEEPDGEWQTKCVKQVRVLTPGAWQIWRKKEGEAIPIGDNWYVFEEGTTTLNKIPFVFFYGVKHCFGVGQSPLIDLAYLNVEHWQSSSDQQTILHVARVPILFASNFTDSDLLVVGMSAAVRSSQHDADLKYVEHSGKAIDAGRQSLLDLEDRMRQTGAELLVQRPMTTTATQVVAEGDGPRSVLQRIVEAFEDSLETCINLMGEWIGQTVVAEVELYKDFGANLSEGSADILLRAEAADVVSKETTFKQLQRTDIVPHDAEWEEEQAKIEADRQASMTREVDKAKAMAEATTQAPV